MKVLIHRRDDPGMSLEPYASRCVRVGEVHELVTTDHRETRPGTRIARVAFLGLEACHLPDHDTVLIAADETLTGSELGLLPETGARFGPTGSPVDRDETDREDSRRSR